MKNLRSGLARARGLGSAHHGVGHWWLQRLTALALIPLSLWFVYSLLTIMMAGDVLKVAQWFGSPWVVAFMLALIVAMFWHAKLGVQVVIEDYVHGHGMKYFLLIANSFGCFALGLLSALAVLKLHFLDILAAAF